MEGIRMYKEKQKVGFGMNYTQSRELKENNRIYREMESIYHEICVKAGISDTDFIVLYSIVEFEDILTSNNRLAFFFQVCYDSFCKVLT